MKLLKLLIWLRVRLLINSIRSIAAGLNLIAQIFTFISMTIVALGGGLMAAIAGIAMADSAPYLPMGAFCLFFISLQS